MNRSPAGSEMAQGTTDKTTTTMSHYEILMCWNVGGLVEMVNDLISQGWEVAGGMTTVFDKEKNGHAYYQAVWKK